MSQNGLDPLAEFLKFHKNQLESSGVPSQFWPTIYNKLAHGVFDAGATFSLLQVTLLIFFCEVVIGLKHT